LLASYWIRSWTRSLHAKIISKRIKPHREFRLPWSLLPELLRTDAGANHSAHPTRRAEPASGFGYDSPRGLCSPRRRSREPYLIDCGHWRRGPLFAKVRRFCSGPDTLQSSPGGGNRAFVYARRGAEESAPEARRFILRITKHPPRGAFAAFVFGRKARAKIRAHSGRNIFDYPTLLSS